MRVGGFRGEIIAEKNEIIHSALSTALQNQLSQLKPLFVVFFNIKMNLVNTLHNSPLPQYVPRIFLSASITNISLTPQFLELNLRRF